MQSDPDRIRDELRRRAWFLSYLGDNVPLPSCPGCGAATEHRSGSICIEPGGTLSINSFHPCERCDGYVFVSHVLPEAGEEGLSTVMGGVIPRFMGDSDVERIAMCPAPYDSRCGCEAHDHFVRFAEYVAYKDSIRREQGIEPDRTVRTPEEVMSNPGFVKGVAQAMAFNSRKDEEKKSVETPRSWGWIIAGIIIVIVISGLCVAVFLKSSP